MNKVSYSYIKDVLLSGNYETVVIAGAGVAGKELADEFLSEEIAVFSIFDNNPQVGGAYKQIPVETPKKYNENVLYILAFGSKHNREEVHKQLLSLGIEDEDIFTYYMDFEDYEFRSTIPSEYYKMIVEEMALRLIGKPLDLDEPRTYNEILNWEKFHVQDERKTYLADKIQVRKWVSKEIGEEFLNKVYYVWDNVMDINFDMLPDAFVLKTNNGSGRNIIVKDKTKIDIEKIRQQLKDWLVHNFYYVGFEIQYRDIKPQIICEEYLEGLAETVYDYDIYCFHGKPKYIWCINGSHRGNCKASFYDLDWNMLEFSYGYPLDPVLAPRPQYLDKMLEFSEKLSRDFEHVRVDFYGMPDRLLFSEMTFTTWSGLRSFVPDKYDEVFGKLILGKSVKNRGF